MSIPNAFNASRRGLPPTLMFAPELHTLRLELRSWIRNSDPGPPPPDYADHMEALRRWQHALANAGFIGMSWPAAAGGRGLGIEAEAVLCEELASAALPELINR